MFKINYKSDYIELKEILKIINQEYKMKYSEKKEKENISLLCQESEDVYLNNRSKEYINFLEEDNQFKKLFGTLDLENKDHYNLVKKYFNSFCNLERKKERKKNNFIDLFCGAGGLSLGFVQEGYNVNFACDFEKACIETYLFNHPNTNSEYIKLVDIKEIEHNILNFLSNKEVSVVIGGPPCQGFSIANQQRVIDDPRNELYKSYVNVVRQVKPKFFIMENVKGMLKVANQVVEDFENIGYKVVYKILNAKDFGIPQNRERLIFIGNRINIENNKIFEKIEKSRVYKTITLREAISDLKILEASRLKNKTNIISEKTGGIVIKNKNFNNNDYLSSINLNELKSIVTFNHQARYNNDRDIEIFSRLNQGDKSDDSKIADIMPYQNRSHIFKDKYYKLIYDNICKTITAHMKFDCNMYIHPTQARGLTPREAARVQSYPDDYVFKGTFTKTYMQIGNSVPPLLGRKIARVLKKYLKEEI